MALKDMYKGVVNSPETTITTEINTTATTIVVSDGSMIPTGVNLLTLGGDMPEPETIKLISKSANTLTVQRGFQGIAKAWPIGTKIARNFTEYDHNTFIDNINDLDTNKANATDLLTPVPSGAKFTDTISTKTSIGLENVTNDKQATKVEFDEHKVEKATQNGYGHIRLQDIPNPQIATQIEAEAGINNTKMMTPLRTHEAIDSKVRVIDGQAEIYISGEWVLFLDSRIDDHSGSPGSNKLIAGTMQEGFFGEVPASEFITGDSLASQVGISQGTSQHSTTPWLKFAYKGKILFIAKKPIRHSISWDTINAAKCVYGDSGDKTVVIGGKTYKVTLMRALEPMNDPKTIASANSGEVNHGSEWNRLMCQIHEQALNKSWDFPNNVETDIGVMEHNLGNGSQGMYDDADLIVAGGDGRVSWCQEMSTSTSIRLGRGDGGVSHSSHYTSSGTNPYYGWRPSLKLVP